VRAHENAKTLEQRLRIGLQVFRQRNSKRVAK